MSTESVIITLASVNGTPFAGAQAETAVNLITSDPSCTGSPLTCTIAVPAAVGTDVFNVATYSAQQSGSAPGSPAGSVLSIGSISVNVVSGQTNVPPTALVLNGIAASAAVTFPADAHILGTTSGGFAIVGTLPYTFSVSPLDATGATIIGDGAPTYTVTTGSTKVAVSPAGTDTFTIQVRSYSALPVSLTMTPSSGSATSVAFTTIQEMWLSDSGTNTIKAYGLATTPVPIASDTITTGLNGPIGLAFDGSGHLWVGNAGGTVTAYAPGTNAQIAGDTIGGFVSPIGLAFDPNGNLWVADFLANTISAYVPGSSTPIAGDTIVTTLNAPQDLAFDASGHLWAAVAGGSINAYTIVPTPMQIIGDTVTASLMSPDGLTFDASGVLWVADQATSKVTAYTPGTNAPIAADTISSGVNMPQDLRFDAMGRLWVANQTGTVTAYAAGSSTPISGQTISGLQVPGGIAFSP